MEVASFGIKLMIVEPGPAETNFCGALSNRRALSSELHGA